MKAFFEMICENCTFQRVTRNIQGNQYAYISNCLTLLKLKLKFHHRIGQQSNDNRNIK